MTFQAAEVDIQSEAAFELARKGLPRAQLAGAQIVYMCTVKHFNLPYFAIQVQCVGETDAFLRYGSCAYFKDTLHNCFVTLQKCACVFGGRGDRSVRRKVCMRQKNHVIDHTFDMVSQHK
ncbi:hypothetical protein COOONC_06046 [Cooperia oncophora]